MTLAARRGSERAGRRAITSRGGRGGRLLASQGGWTRTRTAGRGRRGLGPTAWTTRPSRRGRGGPRRSLGRCSRARCPRRGRTCATRTGARAAALGCGGVAGGPRHSGCSRRRRAPAALAAALAALRRLGVRVNFHKLDTEALKRYRKFYKARARRRVPSGGVAHPPLGAGRADGPAGCGPRAVPCPRSG